MIAGSIRVVKIGGSLLDYDGLAASWDHWFARQPPKATVIIVGGGPFADQVRYWDERIQLSEELAHWMCVTAMGLAAMLLHRQLPGTRLVDQWQDLREQVLATETEGVFIFSVESFLRSIEPQLPGCSLPHSWAVTSDSIAARVTEVLSAEELVLCKSISMPVGNNWKQSASEGYVDQHFPTVAARIPAIRWVNLRSASDVSESLLELSDR